MTALILAIALQETLTVGSKRFTENYILAELIIAVAEDAGEARRVVRKIGLGGTITAFGKLAAGDLDIYPEYTGTISAEILKSDARLTIDEINEKLAPRGLAISRSLGFENAYAIAAPRAVAEARGLRTISDLRGHPDLVVRCSDEFLRRKDGFYNLMKRYRLAFDEGGERFVPR